MKCCLDQFLVLGTHVNDSVLDIGPCSISLLFLFLHTINPSFMGVGGGGGVFGYSGLSHLPGLT